MKYLNSYNGINPYAVKRVRYHARQLIKHPSIYGMDVEDMEQELMLHYVLHIKSYNPQRAGFKTFVDKILRHKRFDLIREAEAQKRNLSTHLNKCDNPIEEAEAQKQGLPIHPISLDTWLADHPDEEGIPYVTICDGTNTMEVEVNMDQILRKLPTRLANFLKDFEANSTDELFKKNMPRWKICRYIKDIHKRLYGHKVSAKIICNKVSTFYVYR